MRVALYYAPALDDPLWQAGCAWLGRDPETNAPCPQPALPQIAAVTAAARLYGFHATLKPPFRLRPGMGFAELLEQVRGLAAGVAPFDLPSLQVSDLGGFLALQQAVPSLALQVLADACVAAPDALRAPPGADELARRRRHGLSGAEEAMLSRWGYQHVFATWTFHMTLTRRLTAEEKAIYWDAAVAHFGAALATARVVRDIAVYTEAQEGAPFLLAERIALAG